MSITFEFSVSVMKLYNGHRSAYIALRVGRRTFYLMRWDVARLEKPKYRPRFFSRDGLMAWVSGRYVT